MNKLNLILLCLIGWQIGHAQNVGIGTTTPAASAQLEVSSTNKGFLMPRMTTAQRDSIVSPAVGLQIFNLDDQCTDLYDGTNWIKTCGLKAVGTATDPFHPTPDSWAQKANFGGVERNTAVGFSIGSKGYIGTGTSNGFKDDFWEYDPLSNTWTQKASVGGGIRYFAVGFSIGGKGYIGTGADVNFKKDFWEYDPATNVWTKKTDFGGTARTRAVGFSIGGKGYIGTGNDGANKKDFWEYNPVNDTWTKKTDFGGTARMLATGFSIGGKGYIGTGSDGVYKKDFWEYNPVNDTWTAIADFAGTSRSGAVGFSIGSKGYIGTGSDGSYKKDFWEYDPSTNVWTKKADFSGAPRWSAVGFSIGKRGYIGTGLEIIEPYGYLKNDFWEYLDSNATGIAYANVTGLTADNLITYGAWSLYNGTLHNVNTGNVGIGTKNPVNKLVVEGAGGFKASSTNAGSGTSDWIAGNFGGTSGDRVVMGIIGGKAAIGAHNQTLSAWADLVLNPGAGNIGIGTNTPAEKLDVAGGIKASTTLTAGGLSTAGIVTNTANGLLGTTPVVGVANGGTGANSLTGYIKGNGTGAMTALPALPATDLTGIVPAANGGTGASTLTGYIKGNGTDAMTALTALPATDLTGIVPVANGGTGASTLTGYIKGNGTGAMTALSALPATDLAGIVSVANGGTGTGTAFTAGSLVFAGASGLYSQNNAQLFWNNTNQRLGIGTLSPTHKLTVSGTGGILSSTTNAGSGTADWIAGNFGATTGNRVVMGLLNGQATIGAHNSDLTAWANLAINAGGGNVGIGTNNPTNKLTVSGNVNISGLGGSGNRRVYADDNGTLNTSDDAGCVVRTQAWTADAAGKGYAAGTYEAPSIIVTDGTYGDTRLANSGAYNKTTGNTLATGLFTAPNEGYYMVSVHLLDLVANSRLWLVASLNGNVPSDFIDQPVLNQCANCFDVTFSKIIYLFEGDLHRILRHTSGGAINNMIVSYRKL